MTDANRIPLKTKLAFGVGAAGEAVGTFAFATFTFFYYNQVLHLSGTLAGLATTISLVFDAVSDPVVGAISDRWRSQLGRRHPFMFAAAVPLGIVFFCIFSPPAGLEEWALFAWFTVFSILMRLLVTVFSIPHLALGAEMSSDYLQRSVIMSYNAVFGWVGGASIFLIGNIVYFRETDAHQNGLLNGAAYPEFGLAASIIITTALLACSWFTRDQIPRLPKVADDTLGLKPGLMLAELLDVLRNRNYLMLLMGLFCLALTLGTQETIRLHMTTFFWGLVPKELAWFPLGSGIGFIFAFVLTPRLHRVFDKRATALAALAALVVFSTAPVLGRLAGLMPVNDHPALLPLLVAFSGASYCAVAILSISAMSMLADIADQHELKTGQRKEGILYSARTFFSKATSALGHLVGGIAIDLIGFPVGAKPGEVAQDAVISLGLLDGPIAVIPAIIAMFFYGRYAITRDRHHEIRRELAERKTSGVANVSA